MRNEYKDMSTAILGFGRAGRAATDFLLGRVACLTVYDEVTPDAATLTAYKKKGVRFCIGAFPERFSEQLLVRSPVIRPDHPSIVASVARGAVLTSETELFLAHCRAHVIGITGSDGKTTTANLTALLLRGAGHTVYLGGNNGTPLLPLADGMRASDFAVLELSSFQLMTVTRSPEIAVITNITPNHLNWHTDMAEYTAAKHRIFECGARRLVLNENLTHRCASHSVPTTVFSAQADAFTLTDERGKRHYSISDTFMLKGAHNRENLAAAFAAVREFITPDTVREALRGFHGVPHRLQYVDTVADVRYYNSSIDTSPSRTAAALSALGGSPIVIVGGRGKGVSFAPLGDALARHARAVFLYGEAAPDVEHAVAGRVPTHRFGAFHAAFYAAAKSARAGDTVLLSPACTAFDQFRDFEHRGDVFCDLVRELKEQQRKEV